jgi:tRNA U34 5-methylaminomethyl-2-thiouridine-forming methyltransferase MnmC
MHHSGGAMAETNLIYGNPIRETLKSISQPSFLVVGLGLGYIELVIAREALLQNKGPADIGIIRSYESVPELREFFFNWVWEKEGSLSEEVLETYNHVANSVAENSGTSVSQLKIFLREKIKNLEDIYGALQADDQISGSFSAILYDAFSSKTSPHLWDEQFLKRVFQAANEDALFSTYACRATLKTALKDSGFEVVVREGFQGKRNSTLGLRGQLIST